MAHMAKQKCLQLATPPGGNRITGLKVSAEEFPGKGKCEANGMFDIMTWVKIDPGPTLNHEPVEPI